VRIVGELAGVLLHVDAPDADALPRAADLDLDVTVLSDGQFVLGDLVALGQVGVEIVLTREAALAGDRAAGGERHAQGIVHHGPVEHGQHPRHAQADRAGVGVGRRAELGRTAAENLGSGLELGVNLKTNHRFKFHWVSKGGFV